MKRTSTLAGLALAAVLASSAAAETSLSIGLNIGNAPPPPVVVVERAPRTVWIPEQRVYVVNDPAWDDDYFHCGLYWYSYHDGYWYRARSWRGPYSVIEYRSVPHSILVVPANHWRHHPHGGPPGQRMKYASSGRRGPDVIVVKGKAKHGRGHGKGHGNDD